MTPEQMNDLTTWLGIIAIASVLQVAALVTVALVGYRLYARTRTAIDDVQRHIEPVSRRVTEVLDNVNHEVARMRRAGDRVEDSMAAVQYGVSTAASTIRTAILPGWAATRGVMAAVSAFTGRGRWNGRVRRRPVQQDEITRFVNEGGNHARDDE